MNSKKATFLILLAGIFWGSMGLFVRTLTAFGFRPVEIAALRMTAAALMFFLVLFSRRSGAGIAPRDIPLFLGLGLGSILFFTVCYFTAIQQLSMSLAAILLYTSPIWVMLLSAALFHETLTRRKIAALLLSFAGCVLVSGPGGGGAAPFGILMGLCSGFGYGLYSILGTVALKKYSPYTVTAYTFLIAAAGAVLVSRPSVLLAKAAALHRPGFLLFFVLLTGLVTAVIPFLAYTVGLQATEPGRAAVLATVEPMTATLLGVLVFGETLSAPACAGILCILSAIVLLSRKTAEKTSF